MAQHQVQASVNRPMVHLQYSIIYTPRDQYLLMLMGHMHRKWMRTSSLHRVSSEELKIQMIMK